MLILREFSQRILRAFYHCRGITGLPDNSFVVTGSASAYLTGVLKIGEDGVPGDIDILVTDSSRFEDACNNNGYKLGDTNGCHGRLVRLRGDGELELDLTSHWPVRKINDEDICRNCEMVEGLRVMCPIFALATMKELQRPKDAERIRLMQERLHVDCRGAFTESHLII